MTRLPRYSCNANYFDRMDGPDQWYWLGFLLGDGCISIPPGRTARLQVSLGERDRPHLELLQRALAFTGPAYRLVGNRKGTVTRGAMIAVVSDHLCRRLIELGVTPRKSIVGHPLPVVPIRSLAVFIRGYFDANGTASRSGRTGFRLGFSGQPRLMRWLEEQFQQYTDAGRGLFYPQHPTCAQLVYARRSKVNSLVKWLYSAEGPALGRKVSVLSPLLKELDVIRDVASVRESGDVPVDNCVGVDMSNDATGLPP